MNSIVFTMNSHQCNTHIVVFYHEYHCFYNELATLQQSSEIRPSRRVPYLGQQKLRHVGDVGRGTDYVLWVGLYAFCVTSGDVGHGSDYIQRGSDYGRALVLGRDIYWAGIYIG